MRAGDITRDMLSAGDSVRIRSRKSRDHQELDGIVKEILTSSNIHPNGILVRLESGEEGRVQEIKGGSQGRVATSRQERERPYRPAISVDQMIALGESHHLEYKESLLWSQDLDKNELSFRSVETKKYGRDASKIIAAKVIASFLNSDGGRLVIGIREGKQDGGNEIVGIETDYPKLKDKCADGYRRFLLDGVILNYFPEALFNRFSDYFSIDFIEISQKTLCVIEVFKSDIRVFLKAGNESLFLVRVDASTRQLNGEAMLDYCEKRFR